MRLQIGICDDNRQDRNLIAHEISSILDPMNQGYDFHLYESGSELLKDTNMLQNMDILLLDIDLPGPDGIQVAEEISREKVMVNIMFVSNHNDLVFNAIHCGPFRFIRKERLGSELYEGITAVVRKITEETFIYDFGNTQETIKIPVRNILYLESRGHYIHIHTQDGRVSVIRGKISEYDRRMADSGFIRIHVGYLVNIRCIYTISSREVILDNGEVLPVSRKHAESIKEKHANYVRRFVRGIH